MMTENEMFGWHHRCNEHEPGKFQEIVRDREAWGAARSENKDHGIWSHHFMANRWGNSVRLYFLGLQNHCRW